jgi:hypothetical protein
MDAKKLVTYAKLSLPVREVAIRENGNVILDGMSECDIINWIIEHKSEVALEYAPTLRGRMLIAEALLRAGENAIDKTLHRDILHTVMHVIFELGFSHALGSEFQVVIVPGDRFSPVKIPVVKESVVL